MFRPIRRIVYVCISLKQCSSRKWKETGTPSAEGSEGVGSGEGVSPSPVGKGMGRGPCFLLRKCFYFLCGAFWALVLMLVYKACKTESKNSFVCQLAIGQLSDMAHVSWKITVNNWSIQKKTETTFPLYKKKNGNGVSVGSRPTRTSILKSTTTSCGCRSAHRIWCIYSNFALYKCP